MEEDMLREKPHRPDGTPVTLLVPFCAQEMVDVSVATKAEAAGVDESRLHDLYVMIFDNNHTVNLDGGGTSPKKLYGHYFTYDRQKASLSELEEDIYECWYVKNKEIGDGGSVKTRGAVKISTETCSDAILVVIANVQNAVMNLDGKNGLERLNEIQHLEELRSIEVRLEQDIVNRKDLFLMTGSLTKEGGLHTDDLVWGSLSDGYNPDYTVELSPVDAKVQFKVKVNEANISAVTPVYWQVHNTPDRCYLDSSYDDENAPRDVRYFKSQKFYFEETLEENGDTYYIFTFYILENRLYRNKSATKYHQREIRSKHVDDEDSDKLSDTTDPEYDGTYEDSFGQHYANNGEWEYAPANAAYVQFDLVLTLTELGIGEMADDAPEGLEIGQALTSDAIFTVHLGDFTSSGKPDNWDGFDNYRTERGNYYTYTITVNNTKSIFTEVTKDQENQPGQEGFLLLTDAEIINADCHYEYHQVEFEFRPTMSQEMFSWYVKTPFSEGGPVVWHEEKLVGDEYVQTGKIKYLANGESYTVGGVPMTAPRLDYQWVMFGVNSIVDGKYVTTRHKYPGIGEYDKDWEPGEGDVPKLMDISQLISYIFWETDKQNSTGSSAFVSDDGVKTPVIRVTAFIDEYYYEKHPLDHVTDTELWRKFVNANPREMHILSDARPSRDRQSDVIFSSHSIIQESIQTIYNIHSPALKTLWGAEHLDENRKKSEGWPYWAGDDMNGRTVSGGRAGSWDDLGKWNGRLNSAFIWELYTKRDASGSDKNDKEWESFLDFDVENDVPELRTDYQGMAYSCMSRNRDNDGDGKISRNEVRWYLAATNQLVGMWIGNESLSIDARLYRPAEGQWRAHIISSTDKRTCWSEEGGGATPYTWDFENNRYTWNSVGEAAVGESVRCLRNIGTFVDSGEIKDISEAPYNYEIDSYFDLVDNGDSSYTFNFDRLNAKSIRELSEGELPYHDQFSATNRVYLKFHTQKLSENVGDEFEESDSFKKFNTVNNPSKNKYPLLQDINKEITALGYNPYCPPGYRFPNQSEMLLMSLYLPGDNYLRKDKKEGTYPSTYLPTRTYYNRGVFGGVSTNMTDAEINHEKEKVGWCFDTNAKKQSCIASGKEIMRSRCVRDDMTMTGWINGDIILPTETDGTSIFCPNDPVQLSFNFFSSGAAFVSGSLQICYTDGEGVYHEDDIPMKEAPAGVEYIADQTVTIPSLAQLGLSQSDLATSKKDMKFKVTIRNAVKTMTFQKPFTLSSHLKDCGVSLPAEYDPEKGMPVRISVGSRTSYSRLTNVVMHWSSDGGSSWNEESLVAENHYNTYSEDFYLKDIIGDDWDTESNRYKEYRFYVTAACNDATSYTSKILSQQILRLDYTPNPAPVGGWTNSNSVSDINVTWKDKIENLNFANGDYIETLMDLTNCNYVYKNGNKNVDLGMDNILGLSSIENLNPNPPTHAVLFYYPAIPTLSPDPDLQGTPWLKMSAGSWSQGTAGKIPGCDNISSLLFVFDKDGFSTNGARYTGNVTGWSGVKTELTGATTLWIGSEEGVHHSRATYNYIRVVRIVDP